VPERLTLGLVYEIPMGAGLDTLAAFSDGSVRYLNKGDKAAIIEPGAPHAEQVVTLAKGLVRGGGQRTVAHAKRLNRPRMPRPSADRLRVTWLTSDGIYLIEARTTPAGPPVSHIDHPVFGGLLGASHVLLTAVVDLSLSRRG